MLRLLPTVAFVYGGMALSTASWPAPPPEYEQPAGFEVGSYVAHSAVDDIGLNTVGTEPNSQQQFQFFLVRRAWVSLLVLMCSVQPTIATKIMDGLFVGSQEASHDMTFMQSNKITRIINCVGQSAPNLMARFGVKYLTFRWPENGGVIAFDNQVATCCVYSHHTPVHLKLLIRANALITSTAS